MLFGSHKVTKTQRFSQSRHPGASVGKPSQILPTCGEVATHGVDGGGWQFTRGGMRALTPPSTTLCVVPLPVNGED
jgi:hypothetical protein